MRKNIKELTLEQAREILEWVYPNQTDLTNPTNYTYDCTGLSFDPILTPDGGEQITFGGKSLIGIKYHNGQDYCLLPFDDTKVIFWLYQHNFEIEDINAFIEGALMVFIIMK